MKCFPEHYSKQKQPKILNKRIVVRKHYTYRLLKKMRQ